MKCETIALILSGTTVLSLVGLIAMNRMKKQLDRILNNYYGYETRKPK